MIGGQLVFDSSIRIILAAVAGLLCGLTPGLGAASSSHPTSRQGEPIPATPSLADAAPVVSVETPHPDQEAGKPHRPFVPTSDYRTRTVEGWTIHVNKGLLTDQRELGERALRLLDVKLYDIVRVVPARAVEQLRQVPIWLGINDGHALCSEYHPNRDWLAANGYNPDKAKSVEIGNASRFIDWAHDQPFMVLHELAHAYHDRVLSFDNPEVKAAYDHALKAGLYASVLRCNGKMERAYALTDEHEYFAEGTESYFGTNDYYPFVRAELQAYDPILADLLKKVWGL